MGVCRILRQGPHDGPEGQYRSPAPRFHAQAWWVRKGLDRRGRSRARRCAGLIVLGWLLLAQPAEVVAQEQASTPAVSLAIRHLHSADRLARLGLTEFAVEHLLEIDPASLPEDHLLSYTGLIALAVERLSFVDRSLKALVRANLENERLGSLAHTWNAWAVLSIKDGRVSPALEAWDRGLRQETSRDRRLAIFGRALAHVRRVVVHDRGHIEYDPDVQAGALRAFVATWAKKSDLGTDLRIVKALFAMEARIDVEGPEAEFWADHYLTLTEASPQALHYRGLLESQRGRQDRALPWFLWAAYTDDLRSDLSPRSWKALAYIYGEIGWCDHAAEAFGLSLARGDPPQCLQGHEEPERAAECRYWHDQLLGYSPERMVIRWRRDWQSSFPDLRIWKAKCKWADPDPFGAMHRVGGCARPARPLPRLAAVRLGHDWSPERLLCTLNLTTIQSQPLVSRFHEAGQYSERILKLSASSQSQYWAARAFFALRQGDLEAAIPYFEKALELNQTDHLKPPQLFSFLSALRASPIARGSRSAALLLDRFERMKDPQGLPRLYGRSHVLASGWRSVDPESPTASRWSERALLDSLSDTQARELAFVRTHNPASPWRPLDPAYGWLGRAQIELARGRAAAALPYLLWAHQESEGQETTQKLVGVYSRLRWWDLAIDLASTYAPELPELSALDPKDLLHSKLPDRCRSLYSKLEQADASGAVRATGGQWRERITGFANWQTLCASR